MSNAQTGGSVDVAVIGAGGLANSVHLPSLQELEDVNIVAVCDMVESKAVAAAAKYGIPKVYTLYKEMLAKETFDAVFVLVEPANLFHVTWYCLDAGVHTYMEKPPGITLYQAQSLARKSDEAGRHLQVGFNRRFIPVVRHVKEYVEKHTTINQVEGCFFKFGNAAFDRGSLPAFESDTIHAIDLVRWMAGGTPVKAAMVAGQYGDSPVQNAWNAVSQFDNGVTGIIKANYATGARVHTFELHGAGVSAYINLGFGAAAASAKILVHQGQVRYSLASAGAADEPVQEIDGMELAGSTEFYRFYGFFQEDRHFIDCVKSGATPETCIQEAVKTFEYVELMRKGEF